MHLFECSDGVEIHHNYNYSGDARIVDVSDGTTIRIPCEDLIAFVAQLARQERVAVLENADAYELLGLKRPSDLFR